MGENTIRNIVTTIRRWYFCLALKKARIKFTNHSARKQQSQSEESKHCIRSGIVMVTGHRSVNFLHDYDEADEEEQLRLSLTIFKPDEIMKTSALRKSKYW